VSESKRKEKKIHDSILFSQFLNDSYVRDIKNCYELKVTIEITARSYAKI